MNQAETPQQRAAKTRVRFSLQSISIALLFLGYLALILLAYKDYLVSSAIPAIDTPGHVYLIDRLIESLGTGQSIFYDRFWFSGWSAFQFYGWSAHLFSALVAIAIGHNSPNPSQLVVYILSVVGVGLLPLSIYLAARPLIGARKVESLERLLLAFSSVVFGLWFTAANDPDYTIGAGTILESGLFAQLFGWHIFLWYVGACFRFAREDWPASGAAISIFYGLLAITHPQNWVFASFLAVFVFFLLPSGRPRFFIAHCIGVGLVSFWLIPALSLSAEYLSDVAIRYRGDLVGLFLSEPIVALFSQSRLSSVQESLAAGFLLLSAIAAIICSRSNKCIRIAVLVSVLLAVIIRSDFVRESIPIALHYYRFNSSLILLVLMVYSAIPAILYGQSGTVSWFKSCFRNLTLFGYLGLGVVTGSLALRSIIEQPKLNHQHLYEQDQVVSHLLGAPALGRVLCEYFADAQVLGFADPHYIVTQLNKNRIETINGVMIQSSLAYQFPVVSAHELGAEMYSTDLFISNPREQDDNLRINQLKALGVTHIVAYSAGFLEKLTPHAVGGIEEIGKFRIVQIADPPPPLIRPVVKPIVGYLDLDRSLPFKFIEHYFHASVEYADKFEIVSLPLDRPLSLSLRGIIVHGTEADLSSWLTRFNQGDEKQEIILFPPNYEPAINHYAVGNRVDDDRERYRALERFLGDPATTPALRRFSTFEELPEDWEFFPRFSWAADGQAVTISGLFPGLPVILNYSFSPHFISDDAEIYRLGAERILVLPRAQTVKLTFASDSQELSQFSLGLSGFSIFALALLILLKRSINLN